MPECLICFHEIQSLDNVIACSLCKNKFVHIGCYKEWWDSHPKDNCCIHCRQPNVLIIKKKPSENNCFLSFFFSKICCHFS